MAPLVVTSTLHIEAHRSAVWAALTQPELITEWFSDTATIDLRPGGDGTIGWDRWGTFPLVIEEVDEPSIFAFRWTPGSAAGPDATTLVRFTLVRFTLVEKDGGTELTVTETGWESYGDTAGAMAQDHDRGWADHTLALQEFLEKQDSM